MHPELTTTRQDRMTAIADRAARQAALLWRRGMGEDFDGTWAGISPRVTELTAAAQVSVAAGASSYLAAVTRAAGEDELSAGPVRAASFAGIDGSGRTLEGLLYGAVTTAKDLIGRGAGLQSALSGGGVYLQTMVHTAAYDTGRSSNLTAMSSHKVTHYVRALSAGACGRCAALAGIASAKTPFERHPRCRCVAEPVTENETSRSSGRFSSPSAYFDSLSREEQDKAFSKAGAEAIRAGADPVSVVSARRGAQRAYTQEGGTLARLERVTIGRNPDGSPVLGYVTSEGTTRRGAFGKQNRLATGSTRRRVRLMPETIISLTDDLELRRVLLRDAGYIDVAVTAAERSAPLGGGYAARRAEIIRADRAEADRFYRSRGIELRG